MNKHQRNKQAKLQYPPRDWMTFAFPSVPGAIGYVIYGPAPIPVQLNADNMPTAIEPTATGYNLYGVNE